VVKIQIFGPQTSWAGQVLKVEKFLVVQIGIPQQGYPVAGHSWGWMSSSQARREQSLGPDSYMESRREA
jgi:hypothetical protein